MQPTHSVGTSIIYGERTLAVTGVSQIKRQSVTEISVWARALRWTNIPYSVILRDQLKEEALCNS